MIRVTVENITQLFLKTGQFQQIRDDTFVLLKPVEKLQHDNTVNLYCNHIISKQTIVQEVEICLNNDKTGVIIDFTCYCMDPYEPVTHSVILPCSCEDVAVAVFDEDGILCGESELLHEQLNKKNIGPPEWIGSPEWSLDDRLEKLKHEIEQKNEMPYIENNHIIYVLLHSKGRRACLLLSLDQTIFYHSQSPGFKEDVTFIMADYATELTKNYQGRMIHERHTYYKLNPDYLITYGVGTIIQREKHEYNQEVTLLTMYAQEPYESTFKIPLEKMPPLQRRTR